MTIGLLAVLALTVLAFVWLLDRRDQRTHDERDAYRLERAQLLQRIQAPEIAVVQHQQDTAGPDETWPLSEEESAEAAQARALAIERIEQMEREGVMSVG